MDCSAAAAGTATYCTGLPDRVTDLGGDLLVAERLRTSEHIGLAFMAALGERLNDHRGEVRDVDQALPGVTDRPVEGALRF